MSDDFSTEMQKLFLEFLQSDPDLFVKCNTITQIDFFEHKFRPVIKFIKEYHDEYSGIPSISQINAKTGITLTNITNIQDNEKNWFLDEYETFCRYKALEKAILASTDKLEKKEYGAVEHLIKQAVSIGLTKDLGMNYWKDPKQRLEEIKETKPAISTGWKTIDTVLYGGFERGTLNVFAAPSGHGKSLMLQNIALNWALSGYNVVYISLELSTKLCSMRLDSMLTGYGTRDLFKNIDDVSLKLNMISKNSANLQIVQLPNGINVNDLKAYIKEYTTKEGVTVDAVVVDYLDLMTPAQRKVPLNDVFTKDKFVSEELRNFTIEGNYLFATASQIGRCLALDTKVIKNGKYVDIKDILVGDWIESNNGPVKVTNVYPITKQHAYKIKTKSGKEIICSANHIFPSNKGEKSLNSGLKVGDLLKINTTAKQEVTNEKHNRKNDEIIEIEYIGEIETIDISVSGNRLFYANDILTHNSGIDEAEFGMQNIAGGISKIYTADNVIGLHASKAMKERGKIQIEFMKTRSSAGEGRKLELSYDNTCMRIKDLDEDDVVQSTNPQSSMYEKLKAKSQNSEPQEDQRTDNSVDINRLKSILKRRD
jgi:archaellum biogenesis ATPase FlaH